MLLLMDNNTPPCSCPRVHQPTTHPHISHSFAIKYSPNDESPIVVSWNILLNLQILSSCEPRMLSVTTNRHVITDQIYEINLQFSKRMWLATKRLEIFRTVKTRHFAIFHLLLILIDMRDVQRQTLFPACDPSDICITSCVFYLFIC